MISREDMKAGHQALRQWAAELAEKEQRDREARQAARQAEDSTTGQGDDR